MPLKLAAHSPDSQLGAKGKAMGRWMMPTDPSLEADLVWGLHGASRPSGHSRISWPTTGPSPNHYRWLEPPSQLSRRVISLSGCQRSQEYKFLEFSSRSIRSVSSMVAGEFVSFVHRNMPTLCNGTQHMANFSNYLLKKWINDLLLG